MEMRQPSSGEILIPSGGFRWAYQDLSTGVVSDEPFGPTPHPPPVLCANAPSEPYRIYSPRNSPALHRTFARLVPTAPRVLAFANSHGWLGHRSRRPRMEKIDNV
jgi:hypothetical protein